MVLLVCVPEHIHVWRCVCVCLVCILSVTVFVNVGVCVIVCLYVRTFLSECISDCAWVPPHPVHGF